ncbi:hypothetical protein [Mesorhizobium sp.]|uniref:hypothetical protein n=1 Tax=Mesorhizobium sp. TaxID=1871066 RepID=UPI000FE7F941|nr:hypothetical protein [Mesorhizobium sp.]RWE78121.1 MAG: hypothetical protein EOS42_06240 [Mesorhizobium sp.]TIV32542.1 MAG: hypothetical protein E5V90_02615 [Mesorhizobium sp.]
MRFYRQIKSLALRTGLIGILSVTSALIEPSSMRAEEGPAAPVLARLQDALNSKADPRELASLLQYARILLSKDSTAQTAVDGRFMNQLAVETSTDNLDVRILGGWLLANLANENNVCGIIEALFDTHLEPRAQSNLLQITASVATTMPSDVVAWLKAALVQSRLGETDAEAGRIVNGLVGSVKTLSVTSPADFEKCVNLPNIGSTYIGNPRDNQVFSVFIHSSQGNSEVEAAKKALMEAGFSVKGVDNIRDSSGSGVDYRYPDDGQVGLLKAAAIAAILRREIDVTLKPRPQRLAPDKTFGVWF